MDEKPAPTHPEKLKEKKLRAGKLWTWRVGILESNRDMWMDTSENFGCCATARDVENALVAREKVGRRESAMGLSMVVAAKGGEGKGEKIR